MAELDIGDATTRLVTFKDAAGVATDPTTVTVTLYLPDGSTSSPPITSAGAGARSVTVTPTLAGTYRLKWVGTGTVAVTEWDVFEVRSPLLGDQLDVLSRAEAYAAVTPGSSSGVDDALAVLVTAVSRRLDDLCGPVVRRAIAGEAHNGGDGTIWLRATPIYDITTVTEYSGTTPTTLTAEDITAPTSTSYLQLDEFVHDGRLMRRSGGGDASFACGRKNIRVGYRAGRAATTADVDRQFKQAAAIAVQHLWNALGPAWSRGPRSFEELGAAQTQPGNSLVGLLPAWDMPRAALQLIGRQLLPPAVG